MGDKANLGMATTQALLEELRARGDMAMTLYPTSERGADGAVLSGVASAALRALTAQTLRYTEAHGFDGPPRCTVVAFPHRQCTKDAGHSGGDDGAHDFPSTVPAGGDRFA